MCSNNRFCLTTTVMLSHQAGRASCRTHQVQSVWGSWGWDGVYGRAPGSCPECRRRCEGSCCVAFPGPSLPASRRRTPRSWRCSCTWRNARTPCWSGMPVRACDTSPALTPAAVIIHITQHPQHGLLKIHSNVQKLLSANCANATSERRGSFVGVLPLHPKL